MRPILFFDSGVGGLPYVETAQKKLPEEYFYYIADNRNYPYGEKDVGVLRKLILGVVGEAIEVLSPKCVVIACNTASVVALADLRKAFSLPIIGVVPAVKPAAEKAGRGKFGVLATLRTTKDEYLTGLINSFARDCDVIILPAGNLRDIVEEDYFSTVREERIAEVIKITDHLPLEDLDSIVLGCTHFIHLEKEFIEVLKNRVCIIDSREGVINQLARILDRDNLRGNNEEESRFYLTKPSGEERYRLFAEKYRLKFSGVMGEGRQMKRVIEPSPAGGTGG